MRFSFLSALALIATVASGAEANADFDRYCKSHGKSYGDADEYTMRAELHARRSAAIEAHNASGEHGYKQEVNKFADYTPAELDAMRGYDRRTGYTMTEESRRRRRTTDPEDESFLDDLPKHVDWRDVPNTVTTVKDQGHCGSCWSFGSAETIESVYGRKHGFTPMLSQQNILDCVPNAKQCGGTGGCGGGTAELAYKTLSGQRGITTEWMYPYSSYFGVNSDVCQMSAGAHGRNMTHLAHVTGYTKLPSNEYAPLMRHVALHGPVAVSVDASGWHAYKTGVYTGCNMKTPVIDHNVQLVGYGTDSDSGLDYWLIRNSWGAAWGEKGYIRLSRTRQEGLRCGADTSPLDGSGCKGGPKSVVVCGACGVLYDTVVPHVE